MIANMYMNNELSPLAKYGLILFILPMLVAFLIILVGGKNENTKKYSKIVATLAIGLTFIYIVLLTVEMMQDGHSRTYSMVIDWIKVGDFSVDLRFTFDSLSLLMGLFISFVAFFIHVYSLEYMKEDSRSHLFFAYLNLFCASMFILIFSNNLLFTFLGWEGVGVCSWLLISFWYEKSFTAVAGKKAFITNRIADVALLVGIFMIYRHGSKTLEYTSFESIVSKISPTVATLIALCLFIGAMGKSAQFPFSVWLPDAMAGPTPVSALIHAATMVTAGIYLMIRSMPFLEHSNFTSTFILVIGSITALYAAISALTQTDIKRVLAYSTLSQLGIVFTAIGVHSSVGSIFHVFTHAFFKALLFLGAGAVIHAFHHVAHKNKLDEQNINNMGGLKKYLPFTFYTFLIGVLAISGVFPFSGFWSKDEILNVLYHKNMIVYIIISITSFLTSIYMMRLLTRVFLGKERTEINNEVHENKFFIKTSLLVLAVGSVVAGIANLPFGNSDLISKSFEDIAHEEHFHFNPTVAIVSSILAILGLYIGYKISIKEDYLLNKTGKFANAAQEGMYVDKSVSTVVSKALNPFGYFLSDKFEPKVFDGFANLFEKLFDYFGAVTQSIFKHSARSAVLVMSIGLVVFVIVGLVL